VLADVNVVVMVEANVEELMVVIVDVAVDLQPHELVVVVIAVVRTEVTNVEMVEVKVVVRS